MGNAFRNFVLLNINIAFILNTHVSGSSKQESRAIQVSQNFRHFSHLFAGCHFKFLIPPGETSTSHSKKILRHFESFAKAMDNRVTISIQTKFMTQDKHSRFISTSTVTCLVNIYVYSESEFRSRKNFWENFASEFMLRWMEQEVWSNHAILLGKPQKYYESLREQTYDLLMRSYTLAWASLRGLIVLVDYRTTAQVMICIPCFHDGSPVEVVISINATVKPSIHLTALQELNKRLNSHLHGAHVTNYQISKTSRGAYCTLRGRSLTEASDYDTPVRSQCALYSLQQKFNFTFTRHHTVERYGKTLQFIAKEVQGGVIRNVEIFHDGRFYMSNQLASFEPLVVSSFQAVPTMSIAVLAKPYGLESWMLFLVSSVLMGTLTFFVEKVENLEIKLPSIVIDMLSSILDQPVHRSVQKIVGAEARHMLPCWLGLWILMMVTLNNAYKGLIYSYLAYGFPPDWPSNWKDYMSHPAYLKLTLGVYAVRDDRKTGHLSLRSKLIGILSSLPQRQEITKDEETDLEKLKNLVQAGWISAFLDDTIDLVKFERDVDFSFGQGKHRYDKVGIFDFWEKSITSSMIINSFLTSSVIASEPSVVPGIQVPNLWLVLRNYFTEHFNWGLGQLAQSGFLEVYNNRLFRYSVCNEIYCRILKNNETTMARNILRKCRFLANTGKDASILENGPKPLYLKHMKVMFLLHLKLLTIPVFSFLLEDLNQSLARIGLSFYLLLQSNTWRCMAERTRQLALRLFRRATELCLIAVIMLMSKLSTVKVDNCSLKNVWNMHVRP